MLKAVLLGCLFGLRHAGDPDHVAAITAIVSRHGRPVTAAWAGAAWGLGHSLTILAVGAIVIAARIPIPPGLVLAFELLVGVVLVALGAATLLAARRPPRRERNAPPGAGSTGPCAGPARFMGRSAGVGLAHGLAGSAPVALLALAAMPTPGTALVYLAVFALGSMAAMIVISLGLGVPCALASRWPGLQRCVMTGSGTFALGLGLYLIYEFGWAQGLA